MARFTDFVKGYGLGKQMVTDARAEEERRKMAEIAQARPEQSTGFTAEQGDALRAAAESGQYDVGFDQERGAYTVTPKAGGETGVIAQQGVTDFLGNRTAGALTDRQINDARQIAMADVLMQSNPLSGIRMRREVDQAQRADALHDLQVSGLQRQERTAAQSEEDARVLRTIDEEVGRAVTQRLTQPDGTQRPMSVGDHLYGSQVRAGRLLAAGRAAEAGQAVKDFQAQAFTKIQLQTAERNEALGQAVAALNAGDFDKVRDFYNQYVPDGMQVTGIERDAKGAITIKRTTGDGRPAPDTVLKDANQLTATLAAFKDPMAVYNWSQNEFQNNLRLKADQRADAQLGLARNADARASAAANRAAAEAVQGRADKQGRADAAVALYKENNPGATPAQLEAVRRGVLDAAPKSGDVLSDYKPDQYGTGGTVMQRDKRGNIVITKIGADGRPGQTTTIGMPRSGAAPGGEARYADGTELRGKDGQIYVVRDGAPVLKSAPKAPPIPSTSVAEAAATPQAPIRPPSMSVTEALGGASSGLSSQTEALGQELDAARASVSQARAALQRYGSKQQRSDPQGYSSAKAALERSQAEYQQLRQAYERAAGAEVGGAAGFNLR